MRQVRRGFQVMLIVLTMTVTLRAGDKGAVRALVDKAVEAQGGQATLEKFPAITAKIKGTFHGLGQAVTFTGELAADGAERHKFVLVAEADCVKLRIVQVLDGNKGWNKLNDDLEEFDKDALAEAQEEAYSGWVAGLTPLKDKAFTLAPLGEVNIDKRPALGVRVSKKGRRDVNLYFDKMTGLLAKTETRIKDENGQEVTEETFLSDYKDVQGTKQSTRFLVKHDGEMYMEGAVSDIRLSEKLDDRVFAKP